MENRRQQIVDLVNRDGKISFSELKQFFPEVSDVTLRKDLKYLDSTMQIVRVHGGAKSLPAAIGAVDNFYTRSTKNVDMKKLIAEKALKLLRPNQSLFIAAGSTCAEFAKMIPAMPLQVFTDGLVTALEMSKILGVEVTMLGGEILPDSVRTGGPKVFDELNRLHFDFAFIGTDGYRRNYGFVCCSAHAAALFESVVEHSDKVVVLMDSSKVQAARAARNIPASNVSIVVSDGELDDVTLKSLYQAGVLVL